VQSAAPLVLQPAPAPSAAPIRKTESLPVGSQSPAVAAKTSAPPIAPLANFRLPVAPRAPQTVQPAKSEPLVIGDTGNAQVALRDNQRVETPKLTIGAHAGSSGTLSVGAGSVLITTSGGVTVGDQGAGRLVIGNDSAPGQIRTAPGVTADFTVRAAPAGGGVVQGHGVISTGGTFTNNGQVIGDGHHHTRQLDLTGFTSVGSTLSNPIAYGADGWYVQRGGQVLLPSIKVDPGTHTYTWGESQDAATLALVNSLRLTVHDQPQPATLAIRLRTVALADPLDLKLPDQTSLISLWQFDSGSTFDPADLDVLVRYNDVAATTFAPGERALRLFAYSDDAWQPASDLSVDTIQNQIAGRFDQPFEYLAVGIPWNADAGLTPQSLDPRAGVVPEPGAIALLATAFLLLPRRRRVLRC
jgi:T5SS/PEP-CTERM-associated repeat protein